MIYRYMNLIELSVFVIAAIIFAVLIVRELKKIKRIKSKKNL